MPVQEPVGSINRPYNYGSRDPEGPKFIRFVEGQEPHIREVCSLDEDGVMHEVHLIAQAYVGAQAVGEFSTN